MFIKKNADKWTTYQQQPTTDPDETAERFITLVDDLSYSKTFYPHSKVTRWINGIAAGIYQSIYRNKKEKYSRFLRFFRYELPLTFRQYHKVLLFSFLLFSFFVLLGVLSSAMDEKFINSILGDEYVHMTETNIEKGNPFGVYEDDNPFSMFVRIAFNNIAVSVLMVLGGLTLGIFTAYSTFSNGIMLGCFQYLFFSKGLGIQSILVIWIHGTLEILSLVISATAGFIFAKGILFPTTFTRLQSLRKHASDALKIMVVLIPVFLMAAFLESYVTRILGESVKMSGKHQMPGATWLSAIILTLSLTFIVWYFVVHPIRLYRKGYRLGENGIIQRSTPLA